MRKRKNNRHKPTIAEIQKDILVKLSNISMSSINRGLNREDLVMLALIEMRKSREIFDCLPSGKITKADIRGYDFTVVFIGKSKYEKVKISVTGPRWVSCHQEKHPDIPVLCVEDGDDTEKIKEKIRKIIRPAM